MLEIDKVSHKTYELGNMENEYCVLKITRYHYDFDAIQSIWTIDESGKKK